MIMKLDAVLSVCQSYLFTSRRFRRWITLILIAIGLSLVSMTNGLALDDCRRQCQRIYLMCLRGCGIHDPDIVDTECERRCARDSEECAATCPPVIRIDSLVPSSLPQGETRDVDIGGYGFQSPVQVQTSHPGIAISNVRIVSDFQILATFSIAWTAPPGDYDVWVVVSGGESNRRRFTVTLGYVAPTVTLTAPAGGASVSGTIPVTARVTAGNPLPTQVDFTADGQSLGQADLTGCTSWPCDRTIPWNTAGWDGLRKLEAKAYNGQWSPPSPPISVTVDNVAPTVQIVQPQPGLLYDPERPTVAPTILAGATAGSSGIKQVEFFANGTSIGTSTTPPYQIAEWQSGCYVTSSERCQRSLTATVTSGSGLSTTSAAVNVTDIGFTLRKANDFLTTMPRLHPKDDYFTNTLETPQMRTRGWDPWYGTYRPSLRSARDVLQAHYAQNPSDRNRALQGLRDATARLAEGHLLFGQQFLIKVLNLRFTQGLGIGADAILQEEQCLLGGIGLRTDCRSGQPPAPITDPMFGAEAQFDMILTDLSQIYGLSLGDGTTLGQRLDFRELDLFRLAIERATQVQTAIAGNLYALGQENVIRERFRAVTQARHVQMAGIIEGVLARSSVQGLALVSQLRELQVSAQKLAHNLNPLGIDEKYTPLLSYEAADGLVSEALTGAGGAYELENLARQTLYNYNINLQTQRNELGNVRNHFHNELASLCGIPTAEAATLREEQMATLCDNDRGILKQKYNLMESARAQVQVVEERLRAIPERIRISQDRDAKIVHETWTTGVELGNLAYAAVINSSVNYSAGISAGFPWHVSVSVGVSWNPNARELARIQQIRELVLAASQVRILGFHSEAFVRNALLDQAVEARNLEVAAFAAQAAIVEYNNASHRTRTLITLRDQAVRDIDAGQEPIRVLLLQHHRQALDALVRFNDSVRRLYLEAKILEYELVLENGLPDNPPVLRNVRNLFKLRRAQELINYRSALNEYRTLQDFPRRLNRFMYANISLSRDILGYNREEMGCDPVGENCQECFYQEEPGNLGICCNGENDISCRQRLFAEYVRRHTDGAEGDPVRRLILDFSTPLEAAYPDSPDGIFSRLVWGNKLSGLGGPLPNNRGVWISFRSGQSGEIRVANMILTQGGHSMFRNERGCAVEFSPRDARAFLSSAVEFNPDETSATIQACRPPDECNNPTSALMRRSVYGSSWRLEVPAGPGTNNPTLDLDQLLEIHLHLDTYGISLPITCP